MARPRAKVRGKDDVLKAFHVAVQTYREYVTDRLHKVKTLDDRTELNALLLDLAETIEDAVSESLDATEKIIDKEAK